MNANRKEANLPRRHRDTEKTVCGCHLERVRRSNFATRGPRPHPVLVRRGGAEAESKDPEDVSSAMQMQGILANTVSPAFLAHGEPLCHKDVWGECLGRTP